MVKSKVFAPVAFAVTCWLLPLTVGFAQTTHVKHTQTKPVHKKVVKRHGALLDNDRTYVNSSGRVVHSPAHSLNHVIPAGATAECRDGTFSFSQSHRGTCSHHGGVKRWL